MRVIADTNVLVSALLSQLSAPAQLITLWRQGRFTLLTSAEQLDELRRVTRYPKIRERLEPALAGRLINELGQVAEMLGSLPWVTLCADPFDNYLLAMIAPAAALAAGNRTRRSRLRLSRGRVSSARGAVSMTIRSSTIFAGVAVATFALGASNALADPAPWNPAIADAQPARLNFGVYAPGTASLFEPTQLFLWGGRNYCWYDLGWHGPGYYWCGYAGRRGYGWGGPSGWHGWGHGRGYGRDHRGGGFHGGGGYHGGGYHAGGGYHGGGQPGGFGNGGHGGGFHGGGTGGGGGFHGGGHGAGGGHGGGGGHAGGHGGGGHGHH